MNFNMQLLAQVYDGRTGMPLEQPVTVGVSYIIKLCHMVRATRPCWT